VGNNLLNDKLMVSRAHPEHEAHPDKFRDPWDLTGSRRIRRVTEVNDQSRCEQKGGDDDERNCGFFAHLPVSVRRKRGGGNLEVRSVATL
jgi:hypothetical protein